MDRLTGKNLLILGLARQGKALARFAAGVGATVTVSDLGSEESLRPVMNDLADLKIEYVLGKHPLSLLDNCDLIALSGSVPIDAPFVLEARRRGIPLTNDSQEFLRRCKTENIIGITASAGKTTTTSLVAAIGAKSDQQTWVGGNIGFPLIERVDEINPGDLVVQELSSFQLEIWLHSPKIAAILNVTPNHLDRHKVMAVYAAAKGNLIRHQTKDDVTVLSADDAGAAQLAPLTRGRVLWFGLDKAKMAGKDGATVKNGRIVIRTGDSEIDVMSVDAIPLIGRHNVLNVLAASLLAHTAGIGPDDIEAAVREFEAVPHRQELVATLNGVQYVNDSIATAPERALAALAAYKESGDPLILLAGGRDKNMVWEPWAKTVKDQVKTVILFGALSHLLKEKLAEVGRSE
ncbi:MAG: UDP-N-acetylmuramoyl-L-alanine--D-glutamate ligase, partial [Anaerolineae bacterium]